MSAGIELTDMSTSPMPAATMMTTTTTTTTTTAPAAWAFAGATFLGAFLLFFVQPMIARYILPWFGGGAAVWTTCLLFFQAVLLIGYAYAHLGVSRLRPRAQATVHVGLLLAAVALAAVGAVPSDRWKPPAGESFPVGRILALLAVSVGLPCVALSATSPLLHAWYARARPGAGRSVYRLYALSNAGSLLALVGYPFLFEPALSRRGQATLWVVALAAYAALCAYCARVAARPRPTPADAAPSSGEADPADGGGDDARPGVGRRFLWVALPACASVLLLATTNTMTQDLAPVPLLWVLPLALYLLTFILAFEFGRFYRRRAFGWALALAAAAVCVVLFFEYDPDFLAGNPLGIRLRIGLLAGAMFVGCMALHGELAALRPHPRHLTGYYLAIAAGGAVGGLLVAVGAPLVLDRYAELHVGVWLCCALSFVAPHLARSTRRAAGGGPGIDYPGIVLAVAGLMTLGAALWTIATRPAERGIPLYRSRDFYGALAVYRSRPTGSAADDLIWLNHGTIIHGLMYLDPSKQSHPTKYFTETSGAGKVFTDPAWAGRPRRVGVVGLGAGTLAAFGRPGDVFRFYEISPAAARFAADPFRFLHNSKATCEVVLGDGRVSLEREPPQKYDILVLDAFSGDAVPVHLLTSEAFDAYRRHLAPGGVVLVNCTNRYVDLRPVLAKLAGRLGWAGAYVADPSSGGGFAAAPSEWVVLSPDPARIEHVRRSGGQLMRTDLPFDLWTDERTNLVKVLR